TGPTAGHSTASTGSSAPWSSSSIASKAPAACTNVRSVTAICAIRSRASSAGGVTRSERGEVAAEVAERVSAVAQLDLPGDQPARVLEVLGAPDRQRAL